MFQLEIAHHLAFFHRCLLLETIWYLWEEAHMGHMGALNPNCNHRLIFHVLLLVWIGFWSIFIELVKLFVFQVTAKMQPHLQCSLPHFIHFIFSSQLKPVSMIPWPHFNDPHITSVYKLPKGFLLSPSMYQHGTVKVGRWAGNTPWVR